MLNASTKVRLFWIYFTFKYEIELETKRERKILSDCVFGVPRHHFAMHLPLYRENMATRLKIDDNGDSSIR